MDELEELVKAIYKGTPNDAMNCLVRYIEFSDAIVEYRQNEEIEKADIYRYKYGRKS